jgi:protein slowmo, putative (fragment)
VSNGILKSHRLIRAEWGLPQWAVRLVGAGGVTYASEHSEVDQEKKIMTLFSRNVNTNIHKLI